VSLSPFFSVAGFAVSFTGSFALGSLAGIFFIPLVTVDAVGGCSKLSHLVPNAPDCFKTVFLGA